MTDKVVVALPYVGQRYYLTLPSSLKSNFDFKLWGAGGGSSNIGGNGAGGNFVNGSHTAADGALIEVFVGSAGSVITNGISYHSNQQNLAGGTGGIFNDRDGGHGGGGGGATALVVNSTIAAVAGGGGGAGGYGDDYWVSGYENATGGMQPAVTNNTYANGGTNGAWSNLLNSYSVWEGNGTYKWDVYFPESKNWIFEGSVDNYGDMYLDYSPVLNIPSFQGVYSGSAYVTAGWHTISISAVNYGGPAAIGALIRDMGAYGTIWTTRSQRNVGTSGHGDDGQNGYDDGWGGGGGGGAGYPRGGVGGTSSYAGANGLNYIPNIGAADTGQYGSYTLPGGVHDSEYPGGGIGYGGSGGGSGGNGYAILTFYPKTVMFAKNDGAYKSVLPSVKINGSYRPVYAWVKTGGVWKPILTSPSISFNTDSTSWG